ncbi:MAG: ComF family protein [Deltaproteobacteria bacterium]|nr:ComF family protein [Deltaproteobacteria bacterium]
MFRLIFPHRCIGCETWLDGEPVEICSNCQSQLNFLKTAAAAPALKKVYFDAAHSVLAYEGKVHDWIGSFKFFRQFHVGRVFASLLARAPLDWHSVDAVTPVPLHFWRRLRRGFNPAAILAFALAAKIQKPFWPVLSKKKHTRPQTKQNREARLQNVKGAFALSPKKQKAIAGKRLLLIDDVLTTGATVNECAKVLKRAGAKQVVVLTLARTL